MTSGCAGKEPSPAEVINIPIAVDTGQIRCPEISAFAKSEFQRVTGVPEFDTVDDKGVPSLSKASLRKWADSYEASEVKKNAMGLWLLDEYRRCRGENVPVRPLPGSLKKIS